MEIVSQNGATEIFITVSHAFVGQMALERNTGNKEANRETMRGG